MIHSAAFLILSLLASGCTTHPISGNSSAEPTLKLFTETGVEIPGLRGSYCDNLGCVDTINFVDAFESSDLDYFSVEEGAELTLESDLAIYSYSFYAYNENGERLDCSIPSNQVDEIHLTLTPCLESNPVFLNVFILYQAGGDVSYSFPLTSAP